MKDIDLLIERIKVLSIDDAVNAINEVKIKLHEISPFKCEPVDCVLWVKSELVKANDYNPNSVAPPEMELLRHSIREDGYTQPIVAWSSQDKYEVVDGFHRHRVGKECDDVKSRINGYLPLAVIRDDRTDKKDRIASTIRHNRARGKHKVEAMSDIVIELKRRNWSDDRICKELGMDQDEVLRLCQITGLAEMFADAEFSQAWEAVGNTTDSDAGLSEDAGIFDVEADEFRTVNTSDPDRIFHKFSDWECYKTGFFATCKKGMNKTQGFEAYRDFLSNLELFEDGLKMVINTWVHSCEHYLTNSCMNRIAWLGQAAACAKAGLPAIYRSGFFLLTELQQNAANNLALKYLNIWLVNNNRQPVDMAIATTDRQSIIY